MQSRLFPKWLLGFGAVFTHIAGSATAGVPEGFELNVLMEDERLYSVGGLLARDDGNLFVNGYPDLWNMDLTASSITPVFTRPSPWGTGMIVRSTHGDYGDFIYFADHNTGNAKGDGQLFRMDPTSLSVTLVATGTVGRTIGDPLGLTFSPDGLFVMDFQGASNQVPLLYSRKATGEQLNYFEDAAQWTTDTSPNYLLHSPGANGYPAGFFVSDGEADVIWRVAPSTPPTLGVFTSGELGSLGGMRWGLGGSFGTDLYVLAVEQQKILRIAADGTASEFASELPLTPELALGDIEFSADGRRLFVGSGTTVLEIVADEIALKPDADFDADGDVDGNDFLSWQKGLGTTEPGRADGDANNDLQVDGGDLAIWSEQFGRTPSPEATIVPEPRSSTIVFLALGVFLILPPRKPRHTTDFDLTTRSTGAKSTGRLRGYSDLSLQVAMMAAHQADGTLMRE